MELYEIYKSEGGYRVAAKIVHGCPVVKSSPWFKNKGLAAAWRGRAVAKDWNYLHNPDYIYYRGNRAAG